jgi:hypothetical protein
VLSFGKVSQDHQRIGGIFRRLCGHMIQLTLAYRAQTAAAARSAAIVGSIRPGSVSLGQARGGERQPREQGWPLDAEAGLRVEGPDDRDEFQAPGPMRANSSGISPRTAEGGISTNSEPARRSGSGSCRVPQQVGKNSRKYPAVSR